MNLQAMVVIVRSFAQVKDKDHLLFAKVAKKIRLFYEHLTPTDMAGVVSAFAFAGQSIVGSSVLPTLAKHTHVMIQSGNHKFLPNEIAMLVVNFEKVLVVTVSRPLTLALLKHAEAQYDDFSAHDRDMLRKLFVKSGWEQAFCMYPTQDEGLKSAGGQ
ncbi:hypothetical protein SARC_10603 [Sphaeroforma arctica JP610]|uniref:Uncharacterized protein n=1 Tax=Sphaeroforma arctica JP610 TaxID=667725 RepID=A0A0L0FJH6_9EUKA|nr:hypothetical protein SARC_10603 [Sphaeroforma arctica JP610]KNC76920.1 hypothetical protein SARC_10603 [Sphaeroforma arctica JP610]|eukprot:XP_014150822.1 hypothetical protein SARC_10603 [Sphaeroforma arctica JP610]